MKKNVIIFLVCLITCFMVSCKKEKENEEPVQIQEPVVQEIKAAPVEPEEPEPPRKATFDAAYNFDAAEILNGAFHTDAHKQFLDDPMVFSELSDQGILSGETAVVASYVCKFYPDEAFTFDGETAEINTNINELGVEVPFATILPIDTKMKKTNPENRYSEGMFFFEDNWNWFYRTEWNGNKGWVFGADLYGLGKPIEENRISAKLYETAGKFEEFYPVSGYIPLEQTVVQSLENNRLALQKTAPRSYVSTDDMLDYYSELRRKAGTPIFITTDLAAHCQHLIFDRMLQYTEEEYFFPQMAELTDSFIEALSERTDAPEKIREQAIQYFQVPQIIFKTAAQKTGGDSYWNPVEYVEKTESEIQTILADYPAVVQKDYAMIMKAQPDTEAIFKEDEDFSQYKARGHYTKNPVLESYFRAQMWYGHLHFSITKPKEGEQTPEYILDKEAVITLIVDTVQKSRSLYDKWEWLFDPITMLIGLSDDLSFDDICPLWKEQQISDYSEWASNIDNVVEFMSLCADTLRPPAITGQSVFDQYAEIDEETGMPKAPMGWRLFGQRFTYDSLVHEKVSPPRFLPRDIVRGLDIMKAFGSRTADALLAKTDYATMPGLSDILDGFENEFNSYDATFWNKSYYNQVLYQIKTLATFEQGAGFYFTESPAWNIKSQLSAHGTWAELRHDTILYVKQVVAERAGDGDFDPTYRTEPLPKPVHYIEPNVPFWEASLTAVNSLMKIYDYYDILDDETKTYLKNLIELYTRILKIVKLEAENQEVAQKDIEWIPTIISSLERLVLIHCDGYVSDHELLKMACIADVYTNNDLNLCLEVGVASPSRIYVPLNDSQGGKRIAIGYGFTYAEFTQSSSDRLTDEQWKDMVYKQNQKDINKYMPFWEQECFLETTTNASFR